MLFEIDEEKKIVYYFLSREERDNETFRELLKPEYRDWNERGYTTCVFLSGDGDIKEMVDGLIRHNLWVMARKEAEKQKKVGNYDD